MYTHHIQHKLEVYITKLFQRLNWLASGSRVPFGTVTEKRLETCAMSDTFKYCS